MGINTSDSPNILYAATTYNTNDEDFFYFTEASTTSTTGTLHLYDGDFLASGSSQTQEQSSTPTIIYNTAPILKRVSSTIENESTLTFTIQLDHSKSNSYMIQMLDEDSMITQPFYTAFLHIENSANLIVPLSSSKISSTAYDTNTITFTFDGNYSGTFVLSYKLIH